jgi:hypothetical protein
MRDRDEAHGYAKAWANATGCPQTIWRDPGTGQWLSIGTNLYEQFPRPNAQHREDVHPDTEKAPTS